MTNYIFLFMIRLHITLQRFTLTKVTHFQMLLTLTTSALKNVANKSDFRFQK